ncbi:MAG: hypothetical protein NUW02_01060 [Candidatus Campbellbacteria bacterium]|nr:hypothetical protein [Candidatus Campbellbacteria bacterium]
MLPLLFVVAVLTTFSVPTQAHAYECDPPREGYVDMHMGSGCVLLPDNPNLEGTGAEDKESGGFWDIITKPRILVAWILYIVLEILGILLAVSGALLDFSIQFSIVNMSQFISGTNGINEGWTIIRDLMNIVFVFALLFVGINTILGSWSSSSFNTKLIPKILLAALFINFSMMITKVVIDTSNILTLELYVATKKISEPVAGVTPPEGINMNTTGLAGGIMNSLHMTSFLNGKLTKEGRAVAIPDSADRSLLTNVTMGIIVVLVAMFIFLIMAFMFLARMVIFIILIVTSPIAFMGGLIPQLKSQADKWWEALWGQAFFAPIFFAMLLVVFKILNDPHFQDFAARPLDPNGTGIEGLDLSNFVAGSAEVIVKYIIVIYLLVTALIVAKKVSSDAGKGAAGLGSKLAGGAIFGGGALLARQTLGRAGEGLAKSGRVGRLAESTNPFIKRVGQSLSAAGNWTQKASFDTRGLKAAASLDAGKAAGEGGLIGRREARSKGKEERLTMYAKNRAIAGQEVAVREAEADVSKKTKEGASDDDIKKANDNLAIQKSALVEMRGGPSKERRELAEASAKLTLAEETELNTTMKIIALRKEYIEDLENRRDIAKEGSDEKRKLEEEVTDAKKNLEEYKNGIKGADGTVTGAKSKNILDVIGLMETRGKIEKAQKTTTATALRKLGEEYATSVVVATHDAGVRVIRKGLEDSEKGSLAKEIAKLKAEKKDAKEPEVKTPAPAAPGGPVPQLGNPHSPE